MGRRKNGVNICLEIVWIKRILYGFFMKLDEIQATWEKFGREDPLWAILTVPGKEGNLWNLEEFFASGRENIAHLSAICSASHLQFKGNRALDFGCGVGRLTQALAQHYESVVGIDISEPMISRANELNQHPNRVSFITNLKNDLKQFEDGSFDLVHTQIVLQHMHPDFQTLYLAEFARITKPGGLLIFQIPAEDRRPESFETLENAIRSEDCPDAEGTMRMHVMPLPHVALLMQSLGVEMVTLLRDNSAGDVFTSYLYVAQKLPETRKPFLTNGFNTLVGEAVANTSTRLHSSGLWDAEAYRNRALDEIQRKSVEKFEQTAEHPAVLELRRIRATKWWKLRSSLLKLIGKS